MQLLNVPRGGVLSPHRRSTLTLLVENLSHVHYSYGTAWYNRVVL